ncbi:MAG: RNA pyrophosphohydrolase [Methylococcales bacterium]|nr:RNA pyrophosphohydrolase [Methylococcales bacterium]MBT7445148.1 RNA pyrophosphohydrolase [Methylococcales bacterium]
MIDAEGFRPNVGIILVNREGKVFWARRKGQHAWQFPQGGIEVDENPVQAMYRELYEESGLKPEHVEIIGCTKGWLRYRLPKKFLRKNSVPLCIGQKQVWFLLRMVEVDDCVQLNATDSPEFDAWRWAFYWLPVKEVVFFKRQIYHKALFELAPLIFDEEKKRNCPKKYLEDKPHRRRSMHSLRRKQSERRDDQ